MKGGEEPIFGDRLLSLFKSQILTLGIVMLGILLMFFVLFRNIVLSFIGVVPNFIAAFFILGIIGFLNIPAFLIFIPITTFMARIGANMIHKIDKNNVTKPKRFCLTQRKF